MWIHLRTPLYAAVLLGTAMRAAPAQTRSFLDAPVVKSRLAVRWNAELKALQWSADDDGTWRLFPADAVFLTPNSIYVVYRRMNPLRVQGSVTSAAVADPSYTALTTVITTWRDAVNSLTSGKAAAPAPSAPGAAAQASAKAKAPGSPDNSACSDAWKHIAQFRADYDAIIPADVADKASTWPGIIDTRFGAGDGGPAAVGTAAAEIGAYAKGITDGLGKAKKEWDDIGVCSSAGSDTDRPVYNQYRLDFDPVARFNQAAAVQLSMSDLADTLVKQFATPEKWAGRNSTDFVISAEIGPSYAQMQNVAATAHLLTLTVDKSRQTVSLASQDATPAKFTLRKYSSLTAELGVGLLIGWVKQPTYAPATVDGKTVVAKKQDKDLSLNGAVMANLVCRCSTGLFAPMLQIGAIATKDLPGFFVGAGFHLFGLGKGDVALGAGIMGVWYKDLQKLKIGDPIAGQNDIDSDLGFISRPKFGGYLNIQYKF